MKRETIKKSLTLVILCLLIPLSVIGGMTLFGEKAASWITFVTAIFACLPFLIHFEKKAADVRRLVMIAVMTALSVLGRLLFAPIPGFKPVSAFVIITAIAFGGETGFLTGALSVILSNFYFGQGPWTPFQMLGWGMVGLLAGLLRKPLRKSRWIQILFGAFSGFLFSFFMDLWTVIWADGKFVLSRYLAILLTSLPFTAVYAVSNVIFLLLFAKPIGRILERIKTKYGL